MKPAKSIIVLFEKNERNVAHLYDLYSRKIPDREFFWREISQEETEHAQQIKTEIEADCYIEENETSRDIIYHVMNYVLEEIGRAKKKNILHHQALLTALRLERSMLEEKCFELFIPSSSTLRAVLKKINRETEDHVERLRKEMKKNHFTY